MHYYQFNIADYRKDTMHLTRLEHGIYRDLIDWYYLDERPIPNETQVVSRRLRLVSPEEAAALQNVLSDFFIHSDDGYKHARIDAEIASYNATCEKNKENGKKGGRPKAVKPLNCNEDNPVGSDSVANGNPNESEINPNQEPITKNQEPKGKPLRAARFDAHNIAIPPGLTAAKWGEWVDYKSSIKKPLKQPTAEKQIEFLSQMLEQGIDAGGIIDESIRQGWTGLFEPKRLVGAVQHKSKQQAIETRNAEIASGWLPPELRNERTIDAAA